MDMGMEQPMLEKYIDLMPSHQEINPPTSLHPEAKKVPSNQGDTDILGDNPEEKTHNIEL